jgi:hypothetical protein
VIFVGSKKRQEEIFERRCKLREEKRKIFDSSGPREEKLIEVQEIDREISLLEFELHELQKKKGKNGAYCIARIKISEGEKNPKEVTVIIKDESVPSSFQTSEYIVSKDCLLACAIMKTPIDGIGTYKIGPAETTLRILEKRML